MTQLPMRPIKASPSPPGLNPSSALRNFLKRLRRWRADLMWTIRSKSALRKARRQEPVLFNAARNRPAWQSSTRRDNERFGAQKGTTGRIGGRGGFVTGRESCPWWMVELEADWPIYAVHLHKRHGSQARRTTCLQVSLSADRQHWDIVYSGQYHFGDAACPGPLVIRLLDARSARYLRVELPEGGELALNQVEVMVKASHRLLRRVSRQYGFPFEKMTATRTPANLKPYTVRNTPPRFTGSITAFHITKRQGRFGNNLLQIGVASCLAQRLGIRRVYLANLQHLQIRGPIKFHDVTLLPESFLEQDQPVGVLCGTFLNRQQFGAAMDDVAYDRILEATRLVGQAIFDRTPVPPSMPVRSTDLVIHLRAGDIFAHSRPHPGYAQPPLAFYRLCVDFARTELGIDRVILVYEDEGNPCIAALKSWLKESDIDCVTHSRSLSEDMSVLLAASHCVFGHGTFGPAMALLSRHMKTILFCWLDRRFETVCRVTGIRGIIVDNLKPAYMDGGWHNTPEQRQLMLDYPIENLRLRPSEAQQSSADASEVPAG
jgi:hypothetical protein